MTILRALPTLGLTAASLLLVAAPAPAAHRDAVTQHASVGPGYTISLTDASGAVVKQLQPGAYTIVVDDKSSIHDFHLTGPGVDESTDIAGTGTSTWNVTLSNGTYTYVCDAHASTMKGTFTVGTAPAAPAPKTTSVATLVGVVGKNNAFKISLTLNG
jgi:plastocyanin